MMTLVHRAVAAHSDRTARLANLYATLDRAAGTTEADVRVVHAEIWRELDGWRQQDVRDSRADLVTLDVDERRALVHSLREMLPRAELFDETRTDDEAAAAPVLQEDIANPPHQIPRRNLRFLQRSQQRYRRLVELNGPEVILCRETSLTAQALRWDWKIRPSEPLFDAENGFVDTLWIGLESCVVNGQNIGMPGPLSDDDADALEDEHARWLAGGRVSRHPWCTNPDLPCGTFGSGKNAWTHYELTSPIHWAGTEELNELAAHAEDADWGLRLARLAAGGLAVLSWVELLHTEDDEGGLLLVDPGYAWERPMLAM